MLKFSEVITNDESDVHAKGQGQRSKVKVTEVNTQFNRFRTVTPIWIEIRQILRSHGSKRRRIWPRVGVSGLWLQFEFTNGYEMMHKASSSIEDVPYCFSRSSVKLQGHTALKKSILTQIGRFRTVTPVWIHQWLRNDTQSLKWHRRGALLFLKVIRQISRSHGAKIVDLDPNEAFPDCNSSLN